MQTLAQGYRGLGVIMRLNWDRIIYTGTLIFALYAGAYVGLM